MTLRNTLFLLIALLTGGTAMTMELSSTAFGPGAAIPRRYTCEGNDVSPPLHWHGVPAGAKSLVLIVDDPDAPDPRAPKMTWVHWVLANLPADSAGLPEGIAPAALPKGTVEGTQRLETHGLWRTLPAHRPASLLSQTVCAGRQARRSQAPDQGAGGGRDERSRAGARGTRGHVREDGTIELHIGVRRAADWTGM